MLMANPQMRAADGQSNPHSGAGAEQPGDAAAVVRAGAQPRAHAGDDAQPGPLHGQHRVATRRASPPCATCTRTCRSRSWTRRRASPTPGQPQPNTSSSTTHLVLCAPLRLAQQPAAAQPLGLTLRRLPLQPAGSRGCRSCQPLGVAVRCRCWRCCGHGGSGHVISRAPSSTAGAAANPFAAMFAGMGGAWCGCRWRGCWRYAGHAGHVRYGHESCEMMASDDAEPVSCSR